MLWLSLIITALSCIFVLVVYPKTFFKYMIITTTLSIIIIFSFSKGSELALTTDTEFWHGWCVYAEYYESWNEQVSCRHPIYKNYTDSNGNIQSQYVGDEHSFDVDYHSEYWDLRDSNNFLLYISKGEYNKILTKFKNETKVDLHRDYYTQDGDKFVTKYINISEIVPVTTKHTYENRVQASKSLFNARDVDSKKLKLYEYPNITGSFSYFPILGNASSKEQETLQKLNAKLGALKQVSILILLFEDRDLTIALDQESYWKGGNKNELIIMIGTSKERDIQWCHVTSWSDSEELKVLIRDFVIAQKKLDLISLTEYLEPQVKEKFVRKPFKSFEYLTIEAPVSVLITCFVIIFLLNIIGIIIVFKNSY